MTTFALESLTYQGKFHQPASAEVDEKAGRMDLSVLKESFMKKEKVHLAALYYDERTKVDAKDQIVVIGEAQLIMANVEDAGTLEGILKAPYRAAIGRIRELISGPTATFLNARAEVLASLDSLKKDYRKTILASENAVSVDTKDPFADVFSSKVSQLEHPLGVALEALDGFLGVSPPKSEKPYAFIYGVCQVQDAKFRGEGLQDAVQTLASLGLASDDAKDSTIPDMTDRLVKMAANQPQLLY